MLGLETSRCWRTAGVEQPSKVRPMATTTNGMSRSRRGARWVEDGFTRSESTEPAISSRQFTIRHRMEDGKPDESCILVRRVTSETLTTRRLRNAPATTVRFNPPEPTQGRMDRNAFGFKNDSESRGILRGGAYNYSPKQARASYQGFESLETTCHDVGFRCAMDAIPKRD